MLIGQKETLFGGRYNVVKSIGAGGMGAVYLATDPRFDNFEVAIKVLYPGIVKTRELKERFKNEIIASYNVLHRNVVRAYEYFDEDDSAAYVMEYVKGQDLHSRVRAKGPFTPEEAINILFQVAAGLDAIHAAGITHRDLKPDNIFLTDAGVIKIGDFGVARLKTASVSVTQTGMMVGTPAYFAPEYVKDGICDARADIYALGVIAYEILSGDLPFKSKTCTSIMIERIKEKVVPIDEIVPNCPAYLAKIIEKAMAVSVDERYQTAAEMRVDLGLVMKGLSPVYATKVVSEGSSTPLKVKRRTVLSRIMPEENLTTEKKKSHRWGGLAIVVTFLLFLMFAGWLYFFSDLLKSNVGIPRGDFNGFMIDGDRYHKVAISRNLSQITVSVKGLKCKDALLDENNVIKCGKVSHKLQVEFSNDEVVSGTLVEEGTGTVRSWKIVKK